MRRARLLAILGVLAVASAQTPASQQPAVPDEKGPVIRITVTLVQIDAVVSDGSGRHVTDPKAEDFEIRQDGRQQKITHFSYIPTGAPPALRPAAPADPAATPPPVQPEGAAEDAETPGTAALRIFRPGTSLIYALQIFNAKLDSTGRPQIETYMRVFRDGKRIYASRPEPVPAVQQDLRRLLTAGRLGLSPAILPGDYVLQVLVTDKLADPQRRTASQWIDFELAK